MEIVLMLKFIQAAKGWTQAQLAEHFGVGQPTVNRWLNAKSKPSGEHWTAIVSYRNLLAHGRDLVSSEVLPANLTQRLLELPEPRKSKVYSIIENAIELAELVGE
jgi:transcriptional regulator with XRE-family HTH domain